MVVADQIVDRTNGRKDTFYDGPVTTHVSFADPYCPQLRPIAIEQLRGLGIETHDHGTIVVIQGPRFSTRAESKWFSSLGWEVINMTNYPESYLARELEMCYVNISLITDYDVGLEGQAGIKPVSHHEVIEVFARNNERVKNGIFKIIEAMPAERTCSCGKALAGARA
jgi:5'-methylthioadenosine phosphorylase